MITVIELIRTLLHISHSAMATILLKVLLLCLFLLSLSFAQESDQLLDIDDCIDGQYSNYSSLCSSNNDSSFLSSSGLPLNNDCLSCDSSCESCYGPQSNHCYVCTDYYMLLVPGVAGRGDLVCDPTGYLRNSSLNTLNCVSECPLGSTADNDTSQCICDQGYFQNGSVCSSCTSFCRECVNGTSSGCLTCSYGLYQGVCVSSCPQGTSNMNGECLPGSSGFSLSVNEIIAIVAGGSGALIIIIVVIILIMLCCIWRIRKKKSEYYRYPKKASVVISESFKQISFKRRKKDNILQTNDSSAYLYSMRDSYDPHVTRTVTVNESDIDTPIALRRGAPNKESVYVKMSPATSLEILNREPSNHQHKRLGPSLSHQPQSNSRQYEPPQQQWRNSDPQQECYEDMTWGSQVNVSGGGGDDEEQDMYEDLSGNYPVVPPRGVLPAVAPHPPVVRDKRKETLDNQYVKMTKQGRQDLHRSTDNVLMANHSYVNISRDDQHRLRAITSPNMTGRGNVGGGEDEQEEYVEVMHSASQIEEEDIYDN